MNISTILWALGGTQFIFLMTALGASLVFFLRSSEPRFQNLLPGFAGGVMTAASVWSLLLPAIEQTVAARGGGAAARRTLHHGGGRGAGRRGR